MKGGDIISLIGRPEGVGSKSQNYGGEAMKGKVLLVSLLLALMAILSFPAFNAGPSAQTKPIELSYSIPYPAPYQGTKDLQRWAAEVEKRTNGQVKITTYPGGTLVRFPEVYDGVVKGIADIGTGIFGYTPGRFPLMELLDLPLWLPSAKIGSRAVWEAYKKLKPKEVNDTKLLMVFMPAVNMIASRKKPILTLEDFKGLQLRCTGSAAPYVKALGATPVHMPQSDVYDALAKGVFDATVTSPDVLKGYRQAEVVRYVTKTDLPSTLFFTVVNLSKWNALPRDIQKVFEETGEEWVPVMGKSFDDMGEEGIKFAVEKGCKVLTPSPQEVGRWRQQLGSVVGDRVKELEAKGIAAKPWVDEILRETEKLSK